MKPLSFFALSCLPIFALAGCMQLGGTIQPMQTPLATIPIIPTSILTSIGMTRLPSDTPSPTATLIPFDTLEPAQVTEILQPLFNEPMNCSVPCFWGIIPEQTSLDEARIFFGRLGFTPFEGINPSSGRYFYTISYDSGTGHDSSATFHTDFNNNLIENIVITPDIPKPKEGSPREWIAYSPETLIKRYGSPSSVRFTVRSYGLSGSSPNIGINMIMYFDTSDLIVQYSGYTMNPKWFCPLTAPFDFVRLWMGHNPPDTPSFETEPLEKASSLTMDQFSQLMTGNPSNAC